MPTLAKVLKNETKNTLDLFMLDEIDVDITDIKDSSSPVRKYINGNQTDKSALDGESL